MVRLGLVSSGDKTESFHSTNKGMTPDWIWFVTGKAKAAAPELSVKQNESGDGCS